MLKQMYVRIRVRARTLDVGVN